LNVIWEKWIDKGERYQPLRLYGDGVEGAWVKIREFVTLTQMHVTTYSSPHSWMHLRTFSLTNEILKQAERQQGDRHFINVCLSHAQGHCTPVGTKKKSSVAA
jgi:hypothetical protein